VTANVSLVDGRVISLPALFWISGCGLQSCAMWCIVGVVVFHTLSFLGQGDTNFKTYFTFRLHIQYDPLSIKINVEMGEMLI